MTIGALASIKKSLNARLIINVLHGVRIDRHLYYGDIANKKDEWIEKENIKLEK